MKADYTALQQHYEIREQRYKDKIDNLQQTIDLLNLRINELEGLVTLQNATIKRLNEQVSRLTNYSDCEQENIPVKHKRKLKLFWK